MQNYVAGIKKRNGAKDEGKDKIKDEKDVQKERKNVIKGIIVI